MPAILQPKQVKGNKLTARNRYNCYIVGSCRRRCLRARSGRRKAIVAAPPKAKESGEKGRDASNVKFESVLIEETSALDQPNPLPRYVLEAKPHYDALRQALIQLSGFLLKQTVSRLSVADFSPVESARLHLQDAANGLRSLRAPTTAAHQRLHFDCAAAALGQALAAALSTADRDGDNLFHFLQEAERHLRAAGRATPGFEAVDFRQACCAMHSGVAPFEARPAA